MKKNVASQKVGAQMITAADGTAFTGAVTVEVTGDAGTQATGSVGSGACTHEGNGYHTYAPAQAETNYDLVAFTFHGTGAIPKTLQVYTSFPQTGDNFARLGAPAGASIAADLVTIAGYLDTEIAAILAAVDTEVAAIKSKTDNLPSDPADASDIASAFSALSAKVDTIDDFLDTEIASIITKLGGIAVKKNTAFAGFPFMMTDATTGLPKTGLTPAGKVMIDGADFVNITNSPAETSLGGYAVDLAAADVNGARTAFLRFSAAGASDRFILLFLV